jgi:hypothetical protein
MKVLVSWLFLSLFFAPLICLSQEVMKAQSEDIAEFDHMLDKSRPKNHPDQANDNSSSSPRAGFNQNGPGSAPNGPPPLPPPSWNGGLHPSDVNGPPPPPPPRPPH